MEAQTCTNGARDKLGVALDVSTHEEVERLVNDLKPFVAYFKVGSQLSTDLGTPQAVDLIHKLGGRVFLDNKFNDIPETMAKASRSASDLGVSMFNVHASSNINGMKAAVANKGSSKVLVVTVLTSFDEADTRKVFGASNMTQISQFIVDANLAGVDGIICSPRDLFFINRLREASGMLKVVAGVRPEWADKNDQKRTATPTEAINADADIIIIGRPITCPPKGIGSPIQAAERIYNEVAKALKEKQ